MFKPNAHHKRVWSDVMQKMVPFNLTTEALRNIDKCGGASRSSRLNGLVGGGDVGYCVLSAGHHDRIHPTLTVSVRFVYKPVKSSASHTADILYKGTARGHSHSPHAHAPMRHTPRHLLTSSALCIHGRLGQLPAEHA
jgi:hypothetical protein